MQAPTWNSRVCLVGLVGVVGPWAPAQAGPCLDVAVTGRSSYTQNEQMLESLISTGMFRSVTLLGLGMYSITADEYDATYVFYTGAESIPDVPQHELAIQRGDRFKSYIEDGGAIVITQAAIDERAGPTGDFRDQMMPISSGRVTPYGLSVDVIPFPSEDPLFAGVDSLSIGRFTTVSTHDATVNPAATIHATWPDGRPMIASMGSVVAVSVWGVSTDANGDRGPGYPADSDMTRLLANSLVLSLIHI